MVERLVPAFSATSRASACACSSSRGAPRTRSCSRPTSATRCPTSCRSGNTWLPELVALGRARAARRADRRAPAASTARRRLPGHPRHQRRSTARRYGDPVVRRHARALLPQPTCSRAAGASRPPATWDEWLAAMDAREGARRRRYRGPAAADRVGAARHPRAAAGGELLRDGDRYGDFRGAAFRRRVRVLRRALPRRAWRRARRGAVANLYQDFAQRLLRDLRRAGRGTSASSRAACRPRWRRPGRRRRCPRPTEAARRVARGRREPGARRSARRGRKLRGGSSSILVEPAQQAAFYRLDRRPAGAPERVARRAALDRDAADAGVLDAARRTCRSTPPDPGVGAHRDARRRSTPRRAVRGDARRSTRRSPPSIADVDASLAEAALDSRRGARDDERAPGVAWFVAPALARRSPRSSSCRSSASLAAVSFTDFDIYAVASRATCCVRRARATTGACSTTRASGWRSATRAYFVVVGGPLVDRGRRSAAALLLNARLARLRRLLPHGALPAGRDDARRRRGRLALPLPSALGL